jgi:hypothetical protein
LDCTVSFELKLWGLHHAGDWPLEPVNGISRAHPIAN